MDLSLQVKKRDGTYQDFLQDKLIAGMGAACRHTRISHDRVQALAFKIKSDLVGRGVREISSKELGEIVMQHLQTSDVVAYIRFTCVYKRFKDLEELIEAIRSIAPKKSQEQEEYQDATEES
jgi:transcriptional repressor NrdR